MIVYLFNVYVSSLKNMCSFPAVALFPGPGTVFSTWKSSNQYLPNKFNYKHILLLSLEEKLKTLESYLMHRTSPLSEL